MSAQTRLSGKRAHAAHTLAVYDGTTHVGDVKDCGKQGVISYAIGRVRRIRIGTFANRTEAMRAVSRGRA
jgi:hypothetical protein